MSALRAVLMLGWVVAASVAASAVLFQSKIKMTQIPAPIKVFLPSMPDSEHLAIEKYKIVLI